MYTREKLVEGINESLQSKSDANFNGLRAFFAVLTLRLLSCRRRNRRDGSAAVRRAEQPYGSEQEADADGRGCGR